jgi:outer membrane lipoprotein-sorting protein
VKKASWIPLLLCFFGIGGNAEPPGSEPATHVPANVEDVLAWVEKRLSVVKTLQTEFIQEKHLAVLQKPLVLRGTIFLQKPALFSWHISEPLRYSMVVQGDILRQWDEDTKRVQRISLSKNPGFKLAIRQMRDWVSGAYTSMVGEYSVTVVKDHPVSLKFVPRETALAREVIESVTIVFEKDERYIRQIYVVETGGDSTLLTFRNTLLNTPIDPSAWEVER